MAEEILKLSTTDFDRPKVVIDGEPYEMRSADELSIPLLRQMMDLGKKLQRMGEDGEEIDLELAAERIALSLDVAMVSLPTEVRDKLTIGQQAKIIRTFTALISDEKLVSRTD